MGGRMLPDENPRSTGLTPDARGYDGFYDGLVLDDNPHEWLSDDWHAWRAGWCRAEANFAEGEAF
ncbi:hypothetical protein WI28_23115 [Burkholderia diffusa]|uniref:hypothetical protein n=1 Tax=Burkholderia diffusa TaxID=488732 RepID=UPI00075294F5|nr:hypothetical protein [Burkholderia diffusa]KUZ07015.1 hypothetical protein WI28_23115 [Burkholderia diffusa]